MKFLNKYNNYKKYYNINEGNIRSLIPCVQKSILETFFDNKQYKDLNVSQQAQLNDRLQKTLSVYQMKINNITSNKQYQSWLYDIFSSNPTLLYSLKVTDIIKKINNFEQLCKSPKISKEQKNILNYKNYDEFVLFVENNINLLIKKQKIKFQNMYSNNTFDIYKITVDDKDLFQQIYGPDGYDCGWCVAHKDDRYFEHYLKSQDDYYCLWTYKNTPKPYALFHFYSKQFKDIHNNVLSLTRLDNNEDDVMSGLYYLISLYKQPKDFYIDGDFQSYEKLFNKYIFNQNVEKYGSSAAYFAKCNGFKYDKINNTVDCYNKRLKKVRCSIQNFINDQGSLDFKLINIGGTSDVFFDCDKLKTLPDGCTFYPELISTFRLFDGCESLESLPHSLQLPETVKYCNNMFHNCIKLKEIPDIFSKAKHIIEYAYMFCCCYLIKEIPPWFTICEGAEIVRGIFSECTSLKTIPTTFKLPASLKDINFIVSGRYSLNYDSEMYLKKIIEEHPSHRNN